uniref:Cytochrome P450 78A5 n=1 Tax=Ananas comosus var. bracteatus TaxID=296719 RepID=A0A6V7NNT0_ANACO|nr:unnamed protein product [Ananas comosus var. bracteatus]
MRSHLIPINTLFLVILCFSLSSIHSPWLFLSLLVGFSFLLSFFFSTWLVAGGFAWRRFCGNTKTAPGPIGWPILGCLPIMGPLAHRGGPRADVRAGHRLRPRGDHWRHLRHIAATNMFSPRKVAALEGLRRRAADSMVGRVWREMEEREKVVVREVLQDGSLETMVKSVFGESLGEEERVELVKMVKEGYELIGKFNLEDYFPLMGGLLDFYGVGRRCNKLGDRVRALVGKIVEERRVKGDYNMQHDFLSLMLTLPKEESLRDSDIIAVLWEMIFRGADVVAVLLEWIMARLVLHPNIQARIQEELDSVIGTRPVSDAEIPKLRYLQAVVKETLRMHPPGPLLSWARLAVCDAHVDKFFVPAGTTAMVNMWAITHDGSIWKDPWAFRPERFLEEDVSIMGSDLRLAPFGSGRRVCPGRVLGLTTVHLWLARLAQEYIWSAGRPVQLSERLQLSMEMKKPLVCRVVRRSRSSCEVGHGEM